MRKKAGKSKKKDESGDGDFFSKPKPNPSIKKKRRTVVSINVDDDSDIEFEPVFELSEEEESIGFSSPKRKKKKKKKKKPKKKKKAPKKTKKRKSDESSATSEEDSDLEMDLSLDPRKSSRVRKPTNKEGEMIPNDLLEGLIPTYETEAPQPFRIRKVDADDDFNFDTEKKKKKKKKKAAPQKRGPSRRSSRKKKVESKKVKKRKEGKKTKKRKRKDNDEENTPARKKKKRSKKDTEGQPVRRSKRLSGKKEKKKPQPIYDEPMDFDESGPMEEPKEPEVEETETYFFVLGEDGEVEKKKMVSRLVGDQKIEFFERKNLPDDEKELYEKGLGAVEIIRTLDYGSVASFKLKMRPKAVRSWAVAENCTLQIYVESGNNLLVVTLKNGVITKYHVGRDSLINIANNMKYALQNKDDRKSCSVHCTIIRVEPEIFSSEDDEIK